MKLFKRILTLCIVMLVLCTSVSAYNGTVLNYLGAIPEGVTDNTVVTREYLAYSLVNMVEPNSKYLPTATAFTDVNEENPYSGYIKQISDLCIMNGGGDGMFRPKDQVDITIAMKAVVSLLGYDVLAISKGGWPGGYVTAARMLDLYDDVDVTDTVLTYKNLKTILANALDVNLPNESYIPNGDGVDVIVDASKNNTSYGKDRLSLLNYEGILRSVDFERYVAQVEVTKAHNNIYYNVGDVVKLEVWKGINITNFQNVPVEFVISNNEIIVDMVPAKDVVIRYGVVDTLNNEMTNTSYSTSHINVLTLKGDENDYTFSDDCIFAVDKNTDYNGMIKLMGKYVRIVEKDEEILALSTWTLKNGGLITEAGDMYLSYKDGYNKKRIDKIGETDDILIVIDGKVGNYSDLKEGMAFYYYTDVNREKLVVIATEIRMTDTLSSFDTLNNIMYLGNVEVEYQDNLYISKDGENYDKGEATLANYIDSDVTAVLDIYGKAIYAIKYSGDLRNEKFPGYLIGYEPERGFDKARVLIADLSNEQGKRKEFIVSDKLFEDPGFSAIVATAGTNDGTALYDIGLNGRGEVKSFTSIPEYEGFEGRTWSSSQFMGDGPIPRLLVSADVACGENGCTSDAKCPECAARVIFIDKETPVFCMNNDGGEFEFYKIPYSELVGKDVSNPGAIRIKFYGYGVDNNPDLRMLVMYGDVSEISGSKKTGIVDSFSKKLNDEGEPVDAITIDGTTYEFSENSLVTPTKGDFVSYTVSVFDADLVTVEKAINLVSDLSTMHNQAKDSKTIYYYGHVLKVDQNKVKIVDPDGYELYYYYDKEVLNVYGIDEKGKLISGFEYYDISVGDEILLALKETTWGSRFVVELYGRAE